MIQINKLSELIQEGLNNNTVGLKFRIFYDAHDYENALVTRTQKERYTNGLMRVISSSVVPVQNLSVATQTVQLEFAVQLPSPKQDAEIISLHRSVLEGYFQQSTVLVLPDDDGNEYTVALSYSLANSGTVDITGMLGTYISFSVMMNLSVIQNGLNSFNCKVILDGEQLGYSTVTVTRVPTVEGNSFSNTNGTDKNVMNSTALNISISSPATTGTSAASKAILDFLLNGAINVVHTLTLDIAGNTVTYHVIFGQTSLTLDGIQNAGNNLNFIEVADFLNEE